MTCFLATCVAAILAQPSAGAPEESTAAQWTQYYAETAQQYEVRTGQGKSLQFSGRAVMNWASIENCLTKERKSGSRYVPTTTGTESTRTILTTMSSRLIPSLLTCWKRFRRPHRRAELA